MSHRLTVAGLALMMAAVGCAPTYAPPVRAFQYGAPARLEKGRIEVGGTIGGYAEPAVGGPHIAVGIRDWVAIELGGNFFLSAWAMGFIGPRFSFSTDRRKPIRLIGDLELGAGGGVGGETHCRNAMNNGYVSCDGVPSMQRGAWGGYQGIGFGGRFHWFSLYARVRLEETAAVNVPLTLWPSASLGLEFAVGRRAAFTLAGGYTGYHNTKDHIDGWFYQLGAAIFFDAFVDRPAAPVVVEPTPPRPAVMPPPPIEEVPPPPEEAPDDGTTHEE